MVPAHLYWSGFLELAFVGLVTAYLANRRLGAHQASAAAAAVGNAAVRADILFATCAGYDASWAKLVRAALRDPSPFGVMQEMTGYRDAPRTGMSEALEDLVKVERGRLARLRVIGMAGALVAVAGAGPVVVGAPLSVGIVIAAAVFLGVRVFVNARRAVAALDDMIETVPTLDAGTPPPPREGEKAVSRIQVNIYGRDLGLGIPIVLLLSVPLCFFLYRLATPGVTGATLSGYAWGHLFLVPLAFALLRFLSFPTVEMDPARGETVVVQRIFGIVVSRDVVPTEIIKRFSYETEKLKGGLYHYLWVEILPKPLPPGLTQKEKRRRGRPEPRRICLGQGNQAANAARLLNEALGS